MIEKVLNSKYTLPLILVVLGLITRFLFIWNPPEVVFDEVHFGKFVNAYFTGEYYFDIHPPLGKLLLALSGFLGGYGGGFSFENIGQAYEDVPYIALRFLPNLAGAFIPLAVYLWLLAFGMSQRTAILAGMFLVFENALLVQSHFILLDAFLLLFGFLGLYFFFDALTKNYELKPLILASLFLGLSFSVKWTGIAFFVFAGLFVLRDLRRILKEKLFWRIGLSLILPATILYLLVFFIHFALLPKPGPGDAFMSKEFLEGKKNFFEKTIELNQRMYSANATLSATHPYSSKFNTWPIMKRPVFYWIGDFKNSTAGRIYLIGNPILWWLALFGLVGAFFSWKPKIKDQKTMLYISYLLNILPFVVVPRVLFLYHYLAALIFSVAISSAWFSDILDGIKNRRQLLFLAIVVFFVFISFLFFAPLSYGLPLTPEAYKARMWLETWI